MAVLKSAWLSKTNECNKNWARTSRNGLRARLRFCSSIASAVSDSMSGRFGGSRKGPGPVEESEWMSVSDTPDNRYLIIRSPEEEFPEDALNEIKDERMTPDDGATFPPCRVEIVLAMEGRLFVVLPTGVTTQLPFACNAPFIQGPARMKIKDPRIVPHQ